MAEKNGNGDKIKTVYTQEGLSIHETLDASTLLVATARRTNLPTAQESWRLLNHYIEVALDDEEVIDKGILLRIRPHPLTGCWEWDAYKHRAGYGYWAKTDREKSHVVHKRIFQDVNGVDSIPDKYHLDHLCRNRQCCSPLHLEPVSHIENARRIREPKWVEGFILRGDLDNPVLMRHLELEYEQSFVLASTLGATVWKRGERTVHHEWDTSSGQNKVSLVEVEYDASKKERENFRPSTLPTYSLVTGVMLPSAHDSLLLYKYAVELGHGTQMSILDPEFDEGLDRQVLVDLSPDEHSGCWVVADHHMDVIDQRPTRLCLEARCIAPVHLAPRRIGELRSRGDYESISNGIFSGDELASTLLPEFSDDGVFILTTDGPKHSRHLFSNQSPQ